MIYKLGFKCVKRPAAGLISCLMFITLTLVCLCFAPMVVWAGETGPSQIILTWSEDPATTQTITWLTPDDQANIVQYIEAAGYNGDFSAASQTAALTAPFGSSGYYRCTATLTGLQPDTRYVYRVGSPQAWSEVLSFKTSADTEAFSFLYLGDVQEGFAEWKSMLEEVYDENPHIKFALLGGDLTTEDNDYTEWEEFLSAATGVFSQIPMMPAKGNHDGDLFFEFFALPENGPQGLFGNCFYSFDYGDAHFVVLDTSNIITDAVKQWLQEDLQNTTKKWKFAVFHHPPYQNFDDNKTIDDALREHWVPILEQNHVDMVFVGHQHVYMRTHPIYQGEVAADAYGIVYVMGNSGSKTYALGQGFPYIAKEETGSNYQVIELADGLLTLTSKKATGEVIETYTLSKDWFEPNPHYQVTADGADTDFTPGVTPEGICTMTVKPGISGFKYVKVNVASIAAHDGEETVVFSHWRNGSHLQVNSTRADFDQVNTAEAGFNVKAGDVIKIYVVDELTNAVDHNPVILQK